MLFARRTAASIDGAKKHLLPDSTIVAATVVDRITSMTTTAVPLSYCFEHSDKQSIATTFDGQLYLSIYFIEEVVDEDFLC